MTAGHDSDTEELLAAAAAGDDRARDRLLDRHRKRLKRMIAVRLDRRLAARVDPSDLVQETLAEAAHGLDRYLKDRPLQFYPWLRQLAWEQVIAAHRKHVGAGKRSVRREEPMPLPDESALELAGRLFARGSSPTARLRRAEQRDKMRQALALLKEGDREVLVLRHLEQLSTHDTVAVLGIREGAVKVRLLRALQRLRNLLDEEDRP